MRAAMPSKQKDNNDNDVQINIKVAGEWQPIAPSSYLQVTIIG